MRNYDPHPPYGEVELLFVNSKILQQLADGASMTWAEIMNDGQLGNDEFTLFIKLSEPADLSMAEVILMYLYYWEGKTEPELEEMYDVPDQRISEIITDGKRKLYPHLKHFINRKRLARVLRNSGDFIK